MKRLKTLLLNPTRFFKKVSLKESLKWYAITSFVFSVLFALVSKLVATAETFIASVVLFYISAWVMYGLFSILTGLAAMSFGARSMKNIFVSYGFSLTPFMLLGWIPLVSLFAFIWSLSLAFIGISKLERMSYGKASISVSIGIFLSVLVILALNVSL